MRRQPDFHHHVFAAGAPYPTPTVSPTAAGSLALALRGLPVAARALMVGIHPDDEDSALLAEFALRHGVRTVYLSLTRGEGGQNRIGPETGTALGILRTGELLAARRHDGAEQLFAPCIDFGYARDAEAAFAQWGREQVIATVVQAIREVRPDVLISVWTGTTADGHGHHQCCGIATHEAFELASDPAAFPEQLQAGLTPWQPRRLLVRVRDVSRQRQGDLHIDTGRWDPVLGRSCFEVAMQGRSLHRCQNMGALQTKGAQHVTYRVAAGTPVRDAPATKPLADLPMHLEAWVEALLDGGGGPVHEAVKAATRLFEDAWGTFHPHRPEQTAPFLLNALHMLRTAVQHINRPAQGLSQE
ncbi:MAG: PIG-L family deacetylase, partial [Candidatus Tectomicrobia bacterium]